MTREIELELPSAFKFLFEPSRFKVAYGGRGAGKSQSVACTLLISSLQKKIRILCVREFQTSIEVSVHKLLKDLITVHKLDQYFTATDKRITSVNGSEFLFKGIRTNTDELKSLEGVDICWVEEGQAVSQYSWDILIPTIRKNNSEVWVTFNPVDEEDATYNKFVTEQPKNASVHKINWQDNPFFPKELEIEKDTCYVNDPDRYDWIWEGNCRRVSDAQIFKDKFIIQDFETREDARFFHGADWGFSKDPTVIIRCYVYNDNLFIDNESYGIGVELDSVPALFDKIPTSRKWSIKADPARPETISHIRKKGFNISGAKKWQGSIEDGIAIIKSFDKIFIHPRCKHTIKEFTLYSYKVDKNNGDILPVIVDKHNHCIDALRYSLDGYIKGRGKMTISATLLKLRG